MSRFSKTFKKNANKKEVSKTELSKFIETNSTVPPTGKVIVFLQNGKKLTFDYFAPKPTNEILKAFIDTLKIPNIKSYKYE